MHETWIIPEKFVYHDNGTEGHFLVPDDSPWFSGHFPGMPILPAIGMMGMVRDTLARFAAHAGVRLTIREIKRVRFRQMLGPGSRFSALVTLNLGDDSPHASFHCVSGNTRVCDGMLIVDKTVL